MDFEKIDGRRNILNTFCCDGYMYSKNNEYILVDPDSFLKFKT